MGAKYARLDKLAGVCMYTVTAKLPVSGGVFTNAKVIYEGSSPQTVTASSPAFLQKGWCSTRNASSKRTQHRPTGPTRT